MTVQSASELWNWIPFVELPSLSAKSAAPSSTEAGSIERVASIPEVPPLGSVTTTVVEPLITAATVSSPTGAAVDVKVTGTLPGEPSAGFSFHVPLTSR